VGALSAWTFIAFHPPLTVVVVGRIVVVVVVVVVDVDLDLDPDFDGDDDVEVDDRR
jgi:hypothetical protein